MALSRLDDFVFWTGDVEAGLRIVDDADRSISDPTWRDEIAARNSCLLLVTRGPKMAGQVVEPLMERTSGGALVFASYIVCFSRARSGRVSSALEAVAQGHDAQLRLSRPLEFYPWMHTYSRCVALAAAGELEEVEKLIRGEYDSSIAEGSTEGQAMFACELAKVTLERGRVQTAARFARSAASLFRQLGRHEFVKHALQYLAWALALNGKIDDATDAWNEFDRISPETTTFAHFAIDLLQARAWTAVASGDILLGRRILWDAVSKGHDIGDLVGELGALHALARLQHAKEVISRVDAVAGCVEGAMALAQATHSHALAIGDAAGLGNASVQFERIGADLLAAEAAADEALTWRRLGDHRGVATAEHRARTLIGECEGARTPALQAIETISPLTPAERQTAMLAATGQSSKEIGAGLCLSRRTVENRLQRVYHKLGVSSRAELAAVLNMPPPARRRG